MNKELDYLDDILKNEPMTLNKRMIIECIKEKIQRIEAIDNAKPSEAIRCLERIKAYFLNKTKEIDFQDLRDIEQALIKAQEQEKKNAYIEKIKTMMKQKDCVLRYIESEDCFAVKTILSDGWYKLTPEFVDDNVREEIKPLPLIEKNKQLKEENAEYKKVLEIIMEKRVITDLLISNNLERYNYEIIKFYGNYGWTKKCFLSQEEFDLLKRWLENA